MTAFRLRPLTEEDRPWLSRFWIEHWGDEIMVVHGEVFLADELPGFAAEQNGQIVGLATYQLRGDAVEVLSLDSLLPGQGIGRALLGAVIFAARRSGCARLTLITTNDNLNALRFYQRLGLKLCALHPGAVDESRKVKPSIPLVGNDGIPIRDELELELALDSEAAAGIASFAQTVLQ